MEYHSPVAAGIVLIMIGAIFAFAFALCPPFATFFYNLEMVDLPLI